jgi:N-ethylmaleimide reductase
MTNILLNPAKLGTFNLANHTVMAPMTRSRAIGNVPNELMAEYYGQRASAGLIITEGVSPSPNGLGYARIPGLFSDAQVAGWKLVTEAVHAKKGVIFAQLMHTGRVTHPLNLPEGAEVVGPSPLAAPDKMYTDQEGMQPFPVPREMTLADIKTAIGEYVQASKNAIAAGFDGIELHGANGYLIEQFLDPGINQRTDEYGGSIENRIRFAVEVAKTVAEAIGKERVGIRLSPYGVYNGTAPYPEMDATYKRLAEEMNKLGIIYIHIVNHSSFGGPVLNPELIKFMRTTFKGTFILSGGYDDTRAEEDLQSGAADLIAFGRPFLANPDLVERFRKNADLNSPNHDTFYTPGAEGYTDYPTLG